MLILNYAYCIKIRSNTVISIHLMLILNLVAGMASIAQSDFNTSNVDIKPIRKLGASIVLFHFNTSNVDIKQQERLDELEKQHNFNTSKVDIKLYLTDYTKSRLKNFNTSNVDIKLQSAFLFLYF